VVVGGFSLAERNARANVDDSIISEDWNGRGD
jgi:hypothetical protein